MHLLKVKGFINPFMMNKARQGELDGLVSENTVITDEGTLFFEGECPYKDGEKVIVSISSQFYCESETDIETRKSEREQRLKKNKEEQQHRIKQYVIDIKAEADKFNASLNIPFQWHSAFKPTLTGLMPNSNGNARNRASVIHIQLKEDFKDGKFSRNAGEFLCSKDIGKQWVDNKDVGEDENGEEFNLKVTCKACLKTAKRFQ